MRRFRRSAWWLSGSCHQYLVTGTAGTLVLRPGVEGRSSTTSFWTVSVPPWLRCHQEDGRVMDMRWLPVLVLGLVVAGCSTTTEQQPPATSQSPPPPPADRVLVTWSDKVCGQAKQLDDLHTQVDRLNGQE